ncbi:simple sugar transport system ATP-binding protein [Microbacterium halimionae]|uniref:Simple sugar transport system ATP-binding protein n=1 Tax=Microbacterium halimionae TaxID=1526413 RepID=A0A7W3JPV0_9MICO|nr:sugar ABC transporter ATP-binding protein [Microbacterium halimionae]MBA8816773.1 simple sugar transport system ATP-binding protein [Microbacterium halimionae]NII94931.1 simple sugar transport system ATP-binding protein [Microbacterium halimionae]
MHTRPLVEMESIRVEYPGGVAVDGVDLRLFAGEVHALMGENGAGKSTIVKALTGAVRMQSGTIRIDGEELKTGSTADSLAAGIVPVYQDRFLSPTLSIAENVMLGSEVTGRFGINWRATRRRAVEALGELGLDLDPYALPSSLPPATQQLVSIARAMVGRPRIVVLDEPTSSLDAQEVSLLFSVIERLRARGVAILFISHFLEQVYAISDRMTVLRDGRREGEYLTRSIDRADLISKMIGSDITSLQALGSQRQEHRHEPTGKAVLRIEDLGKRGALGSTNLELFPGEIVGLAGLRGSGRSELADLISGVERADAGRIWIDERLAHLTDPRAGLAHRIARSGEHLSDDGLIGELSVAENITLALQAMRGWTHPLSSRESAELVASYIEAFRIKTPSARTPVRELSGGTQQKVLLARWMATRPRVLVLDEPTSGIDISAKIDIQQRIAALATSGVSIVFISSELAEIVRLSDRIVVLKDREKIGEVANGPGLTVDTIVEMIAADE